MERRIGCYSNCYGAAGVWTAVQLLPSAGLDRLELALKPHALGGLIIPESAVITENTPEDEVRRFLDHLAKHGVAVSGCNVGGGDLRTAEGRGLVERKIRFASRWFAPLVCVTGAGQPTSPAERAQIVASLRSLGDVAAATGTLLVLETHKGPTQNAAAMLDLMNDVDHPAVRLNFDTGNIAYYNQGLDPCRELEKVKDLVRNVHLKDNRGGFEDWYFPEPGAGGAVDFARVRRILDELGFAGPYTVEIEGIAGEPEPSLEERHARVTRGAAFLRSQGFWD